MWQLVNQKENDSCLLEKFNLHPPFRNGSMFIKNGRFLRNVSHAFLYQAQKTVHVLVRTARLHFKLKSNFHKQYSDGGNGTAQRIELQTL